MTFSDDRCWRSSYDSWKLATPPEYEITAEEEAEMEEREREEEEDREREAREIREFDEWEARWPWRKWRIYWRVRAKLRSSRLWKRLDRWWRERQLRRDFSDDSEIPF